MCDALWHGLTGLPLALALERLRTAGLPEPEVRETADPRGRPAEGRLRVVQASPGRLTVSRFRDGMPGCAPEEPADP